MPRRSPEALTREALVLLGGGLLALAVFALLTYRPGGPQWPHTFVDGSAWVLVTVTTAMLLVAAASKAAEIIARHLAR